MPPLHTRPSQYLILSYPPVLTNVVLTKVRLIRPNVDQEPDVAC
jgi:hypothetical protein